MKGSKIGAAMAIGIGVGTAMGAAFNKVGIGVALGAGIGVAVGAVMDQQRKDSDNDSKNN
tara:strand:+ start:163 stop:342 length:180 start_codon:yes stop_codon:yes gene_type:complete